MVLFMSVPSLLGPLPRGPPIEELRAFLLERGAGRPEHSRGESEKT